MMGQPTGAIVNNEQREAKNPLGSAPRAEASGCVTVEVAHEFSNMLTIVLGSLEQMRRQPLDDQGRQLRIPMHGGHLLRFDRGQATDLMAATIPI